MEGKAQMEDPARSGQGIDYNACQEAVKRLTEFLDQELGPEQEEMVRRHLHECRGCFARFRFEETLLRTIRERAEAIRAPEALREKILGLIAIPKGDVQGEPRP